VPDCLVTGYEALIDTIELPDPDDRHVVAAAIVGRAYVIVTMNLKHFPSDRLEPYDLEAQHPDDFVVHQITLDQARALSAFQKMRTRYKNPPRNPDEFLDSLERKYLTNTATHLRQYVNLI